MSETENSPGQPVTTGTALAQRADADESSPEFDFSAAATWARNHPVLVGGFMLILAEIIWKALFLSHMYFSQDDFVNLDRAIRSPFDWHYLSLIGAGHLYPGLRAITWVLARISLYNWGLDAGAALALVAAASLAALRLLRTLFGERPAILIPLALYALTPLTMPDLGWWWCAMESLPLQLAIFMTLNAHVLYVRTGRGRHLAAASIWLAVGMLFFEKGIVLAPLLFVITAGFLMDTRSWLAGAARTLRQHRRAWLVYGVLMAGYAVMFIATFSASGQQAQPPSSVSAALTFAVTMFRDTLMTGALGGPWQWIPLWDGMQAVAAPPTGVVWIAGLVTVAVLGVSVLFRAWAWRAWAVLIGWVICADMVPVIFGRLYPGMQGVLGLETRYLADAACVLAICAGLAFLPVTATGQSDAPAPWGQLGSQLRAVIAGEQNLRYAGAALVAVFVVSSIWSVQAYENSTPGGAASRSYVANVKRAVALAPRGTNVVDQYMPQKMVEGLFGKQEAAESSVIGDLAPGKLHWLANPVGTVDSLRMFGGDGKLYPALISGVYSVRRHGTGFAACWPQVHGQIVVRLQRVTSIYDWTLHIAYIWGTHASTVTVQYGSTLQQLTVLPGIHSAYLPVSGDVSSFVISGLGTSRMCVSGAESGNLVPYGTPIP